MKKHHQSVSPQLANISPNSRGTTDPSKHLRLVRRVWHYRFCIGGVRIQRTTHERDRVRAELVAQKAYADACTVANGGRLIPTLSTLAAEWLSIRGPAMSKAHVNGVGTFARYHMYDLGELPISELTTERVELARKEHLTCHSPATANHWLRIIKLLVNWAVNREIIDRLPWKIDMIKVQRRPKTTLPIELVKDWFIAMDSAVPNSPSIGTAVRLMFGLGLRESEASGARWEWIDWERRTYTPGLTKGREASAIPMPRWIIDHLSPLRRPAGLIAPSRRGKQMSSGYANKAISMANLSCGISGITPHRLRGSFATLLAEEGTPIQTVQQMMRHKDVKTTMAYLEVSLGTAAIAQDRLGDRLGLNSITARSVPSEL